MNTNGKDRNFNRKTTTHFFFFEKTTHFFLNMNLVNFALRYKYRKKIKIQHYFTIKISL